MSQTKNSYTLGKIRQLIDLNGDSINFSLSFKITCKDDTIFNVLVVDQKTLDNTPDLQYKEVSNTISGNITWNKNIYQNYFLILKSEKPCIVDVEITKNNLVKPPGIVENFSTSSPSDTKPITSTPINWKKIGLVSVVVIVGLCVLWWLYKRNNDTKTNSSDTTDLKLNNNVDSQKNNFIIEPTKNVLPDVKPEIPNKSNIDNKELLDRLRKFSKQS